LYADITDASGVSYSVSNATVSSFYRARVQNGESYVAFSLGAQVTVDAQSQAGAITGAGTNVSYNRTTTLSVTNYNGTVKWQKSATSGGSYGAISGADSVSYTTSALVATTYYKAVVTNGLSAPAESLVTVTVSPKSAPTVTVTDSNDTIYTYSVGTLQGPGSISTGSTGYVTYSYTGTAYSGIPYSSSTKPTNAGSYIMVVMVAEDNYYLQGLSDNYTFIIVKASSTITTTNSQSFVYTGNALGPTFTIWGSGSGVTYIYTGVSATTYVPSGTAPTGIGSYTVTAKVLADYNYNAAESNVYSFSITGTPPPYNFNVNTNAYGEFIIGFTQVVLSSQAITNYKYSINGAEYIVLIPASATSPISIPGLARNTTYRIKLKAMCGDSNDSAASSDTAVLTTPGNSLPSAPRAISYTYDSQTITWHAPASDGGSSITYIVNYINGNNNSSERVVGADLAVWVGWIGGIHNIAVTATNTYTYPDGSKGSTTGYW
jgi:hypothetical protein